MRNTTLTLKFRGLEAELLEEIVRLGIFNSKSEAIRAAIMKYAVDSGLLSREDLWKRVKAHKRREVSPDKLERDLQSLEEHYSTQTSSYTPTRFPNQTQTSSSTP